MARVYESCGATVEEERVPGGYQGSTRYMIVGSRAAVTAAVNRVKGAYPPSGYGTWFNWPPAPHGPKTWDGRPSPHKPPAEIEPGVWRAQGHHDNSCE